MRLLLAFSFLAFALTMRPAAHARILRGYLPGAQEHDIREVVLTEYAPHGRSVTLATAAQIEEFLARCPWTLPQPVAIEGALERGFFDEHSPRYALTVRRALVTDSYIIASRLTQARGGDQVAFRNWVRFSLWSRNPDGTFKQWFEGESRAVGHDDPHGADTALEIYLRSLFPAT